MIKLLKIIYYGMLSNACNADHWATITFKFSFNFNYNLVNNTLRINFVWKYFKCKYHAKIFHKILISCKTYYC